MSRKITIQEFSRRFYLNYPEAEIEILEYDSIKKPCTIKCLKCGKFFTSVRAENFLVNWHCCGMLKTKQIDRIKEIYSQNKHFEIVKQAKNSAKWIVKHLDCGNEFERTCQSILRAPFCCPCCNTISTSQQLSFQEASTQIEEAFLGKISLLEFYGVDNSKDKYRCNNCGLIFNKPMYGFIKKCRGCPKCDQRHSKGELAMRKYLDDRQITYKEQVRLPDLKKLSFDFGIYENEKLIGLIEIQGEQHFRQVFKYPQRPNGFERQLQNDKEKREYCVKNNIPLYEIINESGKLKNLDILPF